MHVYLHLLFIFFGVLFTLAALTWSHRRLVAGTTLLVVFLAAEGGTCLAYAMNVAAADLETKLLWNHAEYFFGLGVAPLLPILALRATGFRKRVSSGAWFMLFALPVAGMFMNWTCHLHAWYYTRVWLEPLGDLTLLAKSRGPFYPVFFAYLYALLLIAGGIAAWRLIRRPTPISRWHLTLIVVAVAAPIICGAPYYWLDMAWLRRVNTLHIGFFVTGIAFTGALLSGQTQKAARTLNEIQERNDLLLAHANAIFYTITPDGRFSYVSEPWQALLGYPAEEMIGREYREVVLADDVPACDRFLAEVVRSGELRSGIEYRVRHKNGTIRWHTSSIRPVLDPKGRPVTFVGVAYDITAVRQTQDALREANERLYRLIATRDEELRQATSTALTASKNEARRIGREIHDSLCQELVGLMRMAENLMRRCGREEADAARKLVDQTVHVLNLARGISHELTLCDLETGSLCEAISAFARRFSGTTGVRIEVNCSQENCTFSPAPSELIYRFTRETVVNAVKHASPSQIWVDIIREKGQAIISVTNDGLPLPEESVLPAGA